MRAESGDKRENDENFAEPQEHEGRLEENFRESTNSRTEVDRIAAAGSHGTGRQGCLPYVNWKYIYRGKVSTVSTLLIINN
jgi:hypothetical protein